MSKIISFGFYILSVVVLGAIGSGFWDVFLKDWLFIAAEVFVNMASKFNADYLDIIYHSVGRNVDLMAYIPSICIVSIAYSLPLFMVFQMNQLYRVVDSCCAKSVSEHEVAKMIKVSSFLSNNKKLVLSVALLPSLIVPVMLTHIAVVGIYSTKAVRVVEQQLDIVRPYLKEKVYYQHVSGFRQVDTRDKLSLLLVELSRVAKLNDIKLPDYRLIGID